MDFLALKLLLFGHELSSSFLLQQVQNLAATSIKTSSE